MEPDAISARVFLDGAQPFPAIARLAGTYRVRAAATTEVELVDQDGLSRSLIYAGPDASYLFVPSGVYGLYARTIADGALEVDLTALTRLEKMGFFARKAIDILRRGPAGIFAALRALGARAEGSVVGAKLAAGRANTTVPPLPARGALEPASVPEALKSVSVIIPTRDSVEMLQACIESLSRTTGVRIEIIVVDNGATRPEARAYLAELAGRSDTRVHPLDIPFNFSRLCNAGARLARYPVLVFLNDDVEVLDGDWLIRMLGFLSRPDVGVAGARLLYPSGDLQHAGVASNLVPGPGHPWRGQPDDVWRDNPFVTTSGEVDAVTAACLAIRRDLFEALNGFDENTFAVTVNDVDLCLRARARDLRTVYVAEATLLHKEGQSREADDRPGQAVRRAVELKAYLERYPYAARHSCFYPVFLRRDSDTGAPV